MQIFRGGTVYEGKASYPSMGAIFQGFEARIKTYLNKFDSEKIAIYGTNDN